MLIIALTLLFIIGPFYVWPFNGPIKDGFTILGYLQGIIVLALTLVGLLAFISTVIELATHFAKP
jgi:hypothetical protein